MQNQSLGVSNTCATGSSEQEAHLMADHIGYVQQGEYRASQHSRAQQTERLV
jgi:hypothetical protein